MQCPGGWVGFCVRTRPVTSVELTGRGLGEEKELRS